MSYYLHSFSLLTIPTIGKMSIRDAVGSRPISSSWKPSQKTFYCIFINKNYQKLPSAVFGIPLIFYEKSIFIAFLSNILQNSLDFLEILIFLYVSNKEFVSQILLKMECLLMFCWKSLIFFRSIDFFYKRVLFQNFPGAFGATRMATEIFGASLNASPRVWPPWAADLISISDDCDPTTILC